MENLGNTPPSSIYAALDLGTNNCRLLIAGIERGQIRALETFSRVVRLGEGLSRSGNISDEAARRTVEAIKICARKMSRYDLAGTRYVATEACRSAGNYQGFIERVKRETGLLLEVIPHEEEARLAFRGCSALMQRDIRRAIVIDIGGGSTECMWVDAEPASPVILDWISFPFGVMNLTERFASPTQPKQSFDQIVQHIIPPIREFESKHGIRQFLEGNAGKTQMLCSSGTITTIAAVYLNLQRYDRAQVDGNCISRTKILETIGAIISGQDAGEPFHSSIGEDRREFMPAGCAIMQAILEALPADSVTIADRGVREGIILTLAEKHDKKR